MVGRETLLPCPRRGNAKSYTRPDLGSFPGSHLSLYLPVSLSCLMMYLPFAVLFVVPIHW